MTTMATVFSKSAVGRRDTAGSLRYRSQSFTTNCIRVVMILAVVINLSLPTVNACSMPRGWRPKTPVENLLDATDVLYATVIRNYPDLRFDYGNTNTSTAYTSEIEVHCILKGHQTNHKVNITQAGHVPGLCHSTNLTVGHRYVLLVRLDKYDDDDIDIYTTTSGELNVDTQDQLSQLTVACNLTQQYPTGVDASTASVKCPTLAPPGECKSKRDFEVPSKPSGEDDEYDYDYGNQKVRAVKTETTKTPASSSWKPSSASLFVTTLACWIAFVAKFG